MGESELDLVPPTVTSDKGGTSLFVARPDGKFMAQAGWLEGIDEFEVASFGHVSGTTTKSTPVQPNGSWQHAAWDGEGFVSHGYNCAAGEPCKSWALRFDPGGALLGAFLSVGTFIDLGSNTDASVDRFATSAVSGVTYQLGARHRLVLSGHHRDGSQLPNLEWWGRDLTILGVDTSTAEKPELAALDDGAWISWQSDTDIFVHRIDVDGTLVGEPLHVTKRPLDEPQGIGEHAINATPSGGFMLVGGSGHRIYVWEYDGQNLSEPWIVMDGPMAGNLFQDLVHVYDPSLSGEHDRQWLTYFETGNDPTVGPRVLIRVLRVERGCVYPSVARPK